MRASAAAAHYRRDDTALTRFWKYVNLRGADDCWLWTGPATLTGYGGFVWHWQRFAAHRFAYQTFIGPIPPGHFVCHRCDTPACVNPAHLFTGDNGVNVRDSVSKDRRGKRRPDAWKLSPDKVREIRHLAAATNVSQRALAEQFGVHASIISEIVARKRWKHVA